MNLPEVGETFRGKYKLQAILGRGGFAAVYRATDLAIGRDVAIKILAPGGGGYDADIVSRFNREAHVIANLQDPHTITMFDFGRTDDGLLFMIFEYVRGEDLSDVLKRTGPLPPQTAAHILEQLASALREAHTAGILHRDLKPANVLVYHYMGDDYRVKLLDFGIAKPVESAGVEALSITRTGAVVGTPRYMSPEQICGNELTEASDIYSLGLIGYEMLVGAPAVAAKDTKAILLAQLSDKPLRIPPELPVDPQLRHLVEAMMAREPRFRVSSAEAVMKELLAIRKRHRSQSRITGQGPIQRPPVQNVPELSAPNTAGEARPNPRPEPTVSQTITIDGEVIKSAASNLAVVVLGVLLGAGAIVGVLSLLLGNDEPPPDDDVAPIATLDAGTTPASAGTNAKAKEASGSTAVAVEKNAALENVDAGAPDAGAPDADRVEPSGCGKKSPFEGEQVHVTRISGVERSWVTYLPKRYDPDVRHPVVLAFHNSNESGASFLDEFKKTADRHRFVVMAPTSLDPISAWKHDTDMPLVRRMVTSSSETLCLDRHRVYGVGHASGGRMLEQMRCEMDLAGIAASGYRSKPQCPEMGPIPYMYLWGNKDRYLPVRGGTACNTRRVTSLQRQHDLWKDRNGCVGEPRPYSKHRYGECVTWDCDVAPFVSCEVDGGHHWSEPESFKLFEFPMCKGPGSRYPYAEEIWKFLEKEGVPLDDPFG